tara:strand:- start:2938 stop:3228 length:291 start_codon:yes stop_codon:yes gene_type:complete
MSLNLGSFASIHGQYSNIMSKNPRTAKYRIRSKFGLGISDSRIFISLMAEYDRLAVSISLQAALVFPDQNIIDIMSEELSRLSVDATAHLFKCKKM